MITRNDCLVAGEVVKAHGLRGEVIVRSDSNLLEKYINEPVFIQLDGAPVPFFIEEDGLSVRNDSSYIIKFEFVDTKEQAERLTGCEVMLEAKRIEEEFEQSGSSAADPLEWHGFAVIDRNTGEVGTIIDIANYSGNVVLSVQIFGKEILLPLSEEYIKEVCLEENKILVQIPQELIELN